MVEAQLVTALARRFISRRDVKAVQQPDGSYRPDRTPWTMGDLRRHLEGEASYGHYMLSAEGTCKLFALDIDLDSEGVWENGEQFDPRAVWRAGRSLAREKLQRELRAMGEGLAWRAKRILDIPVAVAYSGGKGLHVYGFTGEVTADAAREAALRVLDCGVFEATRGDNFWKHSHSYPHLTIELFPKQVSVREGDGLGNLMRLPLGTHLKTGKPGFFLKAEAPHPKFVPDDPEQAIALGTVR